MLINPRNKMSITTQNMHWTLPVEITLDILSFFDPEDDAGMRTLKAFSELSKPWNELVLPLLFSTIRITYTTSYHVCYDPESLLRRPKHLLVIRDLLQQTGRRIIPYVRKLSLGQTTIDWALGDVDPDAPDLFEVQHIQGSDIDHICDIIRLFPSIRQLHLVNTILSSPPDPNLTMRNLALKELCIHCPQSYWDDGVDISPNKFLWLLSLFGSVDRLALVDLVCAKTDDGDHNVLEGSSLCIKALDLSFVEPIEVFLGGLRRNPCIIAGLESLDITWPSPAWTAELPLFCAAIPRGLTHLGLNMGFHSVVIFSSDEPPLRSE